MGACLTTSKIVLTKLTCWVPVAPLIILNRSLRKYWGFPTIMLPKEIEAACLTFELVELKPLITRSTKDFY